jgi:hypothetical protein
MKLALLGADDDSLDLIRWALEREVHVLTASYDSDDHAAVVRLLAPNVRTTANWEELLLGSAADAVIVGRGGKEAAARAGLDFAERRADQLRKLVQARVPLIVVCPACEAIVGFEIEMIRRDVKSVIVPYVPEDRPPIRALAELISGDETPIGKIEQISFEREQTDRSREAVLIQLARDATLLRCLIGTIQTVSATAAARPLGRDPLGPKMKELPSLSNLSVTFGGEKGLTARWTVVPALNRIAGELTVIGERGKAKLQMPQDVDWSLEVMGHSVRTVSVSPAETAKLTFAQLSHEIADVQQDDSAWLAACRDQEAAEAVDRSLARGRTIELYAEEHTEEESFKGVMAMGGCLLLVMAVLVLFLAVIVEGLRLPMRSWPLWRLWPFYLLVLIGGFLLLQLLQLAVKREPSGSSDFRRLMGHGE